MKTKKQMAKMLAAAVLAAVAGSGCAELGGGHRTMQWVDPVPDGYYTGEKQDFAGRFNPDPQGRKFRVAYLDVCCESVDGMTGGDSLQSAAEKRMDYAFADYMGFREQARESDRARYYQRNPSMGESAKQLMHSKLSSENARINYLLASANLVAAGGWAAAGGAFGEQTPHEFMQHRTDANHLNAELERRYPGLFTTEEGGFPLEIATIGLYTQSDPVVRTRFEAWLVGLPEHAALKWVVGPKVFPASEVFLDPYEAIAAALFKLTDEQFEGLVPPNPKDHEWMEK